MKTSYRLSSYDLTFVADALLALCDKTPERPHYSDDGLRIKLKIAEWREPKFGHLVQHRNSDPLLQNECNEVFESAQLTRRQRQVLSMRLDGWTFEEIGCFGKHSKQAAQNIFVQACKKIARAFRVYPYKGLSEVYHQETHRGVNRDGLGRIPQSAH